MTHIHWDTKELASLLSLATAGDQPAMDMILARFRPYLRLVCSNRMPLRLAMREDASDVVQWTLADAARGFGGFRGTTAEELQGWMVRLLERNLVNAIRRQEAVKRDVRRDHHGGLRRGDALVWGDVAGEESSPSQRVFRGEAALLLAEALEKLPEAQRIAVTMRYLRHQPLAVIAELLGCTPAAAAGYVRRGVEGLRMLLPRELGELS